MSGASWQKDFTSAELLDRAIANHAWLSHAGLDVAPLRDVDRTRLRLSFARLPGHHPADAADLVLIARALGRWHARLADRELAHMEVDDPLPIDRGVIPGFIEARRDALRRASAPQALIGPHDLSTLALLAERTTVSVYKDLNIRNVLIDGAGVHHVDVDEVTLAPAGYDLAKLLVSWAMTCGHRPAVRETLEGYNDAAGRDLCDEAVLAVWIEMHHVLTHRHLAKGHYRYSWVSSRNSTDQAQVARVLRGA